MCYHQVIHIGEEQKKSINKQKFKKNRYQTQYNIRALALVKSHYYFNHKSKEYKHHNWWHKRIGF